MAEPTQGFDGTARKRKIQEDYVATKRQRTEHYRMVEYDRVGTADNADTGKQCEWLSSEVKDGENSTVDVRDSIQTLGFFFKSLLFMKFIVSTYWMFLQCNRLTIRIKDIYFLLTVIRELLRRYLEVMVLIWVRGGLFADVEAKCSFAFVKPVAEVFESVNSPCRTNRVN